MIATSDRLTFFTTDRGCTHICWDNGLEMWVSDGTEQGTLMLADIEAGEGNSNPAGFTYSNERMFFSARGSVHGRELWALDIQLIPRGFLPYIVNVGE